MKDRWADGWSHYLSSGMCHPYAAPSLCSRLAGLAPALVLSSEDDPLLDETMSYAKRLEAAGVKVQKHIFPSGSGWPSVYGGKTGDPPDWQEGVGSQFADFVRDISTH